MLSSQFEILNVIPVVTCSQLNLCEFCGGREWESCVCRGEGINLYVYSQTYTHTNILFVNLWATISIGEQKGKFRNLSICTLVLCDLWFITTQKHITQWTII